MKKISKLQFIVLCLVFPFLLATACAEDKHQGQNTGDVKIGKISVAGANLVDEKGEKLQLYGMSTHGIGWFPQYVNYEALKTLREDWKINCIRLAMYTAENNGYCATGNKENLKKIIKNGVDWATQLGM
jgi:endoglucanase